MEITDSTKGPAPTDASLAGLRSVCEASLELEVVVEDGGDWSALLAGQPSTFVDFYDTNDTYPPELWTTLGAYLETLEGDDSLLPGGRYACAQALLRVGLPCFAGRRLGEACHIVELAMSQKKLLGYLNGAITPYGCSQSMLKDDAAVRRTGIGSEHFPLATWDCVRTSIVAILASAIRKGKKQVPLSTLKRLFRSRFRTELSETALGYTRISDLLQDTRVCGVCSVRLLEAGYFITPRESADEGVAFRESRGHTSSEGDGNASPSADPPFFRRDIFSSGSARPIGSLEASPLYVSSSLAARKDRERVTLSSEPAYVHLDELSWNVLCLANLV